MESVVLHVFDHFLGVAAVQHASSKSMESVVLHVFDHFLGVAAVRHAFAREKQTERKKGIFFYVLVKQNKKREGSTVACFRGCHFSVTSGVLKVSRITHVYAQAVVKFWVLGSCPIFQLWKKVSSFIVTTSQLVSSVQTIVYAVSRKDLHS